MQTPIDIQQPFITNDRKVRPGIARISLVKIVKHNAWHWIQYLLKQKANLLANAFL